MNNNSSRFFHHFIPKSMPCVLLPSAVTSSILPSVLSPPLDQSSDHILNLSASMNRHCPSSPSPPNERTTTVGREAMVKRESEDARHGVVTVDKTEKACKNSADTSSHSATSESEENTDMNSNTVKIPDDEITENEDAIDSSKDCASCRSESTLSDDEEQFMEIDVDDSKSGVGDDDEALNLGTNVIPTKEDNQQQKSQNLFRKAKTLTFGIDQILSKGNDERGKRSPRLSPERLSPSPPVVSTLSSKSSSVAARSTTLPLKLYKDDKQDQHHSILSKLKLCVTSTSTAEALSSSSGENQKRSTTATAAVAIPYFHHPSYGPYHHHHHHHHQINSIITPASGGGIHNHNSHHHPLSNCSECVYLRRYCGGGGGRTSSSGVASSSSCNSRAGNNIPVVVSSANVGATNNMQFSSSMATPCGPTSSLSASFTWMPPNLSIYDSSSIISPGAGYNQHIPLQPSFGLGTSGHFSTLATMQHGNSGSGAGRRKRSWSRAVFSSLQRKGLEKRFQLQKYITKPDRRQLAASLGLTDAQVKVWFQNRRMKWRHSKEGKVSSGSGEATNNNTVPTSSSSPPVSSTTSSKSGDGNNKDK